jgi:hypothetical protein
MNMPVTSCVRLLLVADPAARTTIRPLLALTLPAEWEVVEADGCEHAHFVQQLDACDVVLVDRCRAADARRDDLEFLARDETPLVVLADLSPLQPARSGRWTLLSRQAALDHPAVLATALVQAARLAELHDQLRRREQSLRDCRRHVDGLVDLLWRSIPGGAGEQWLTQRGLLERLDEETARSQRYGAPLSVILGEPAHGPQTPGKPETRGLEAWTARQVGRTKRRCDVAGQYGPHGFLLLLPHTGEDGAFEFCRRLSPALAVTEGLPDCLKAPPQFRLCTATLPPAFATAHGLLSLAEERLEEARQNG